MKRDMLCITEILRELERYRYASTETPTKFKIKGYNQKTINYHIQLLKDADFIKTVITNDQEEFPARLTWKGHEYIDQTLNNTIKVIDEGIGIISEID